ncbi:MAG: hypothetical protein ACRDIX_07670 [Actinomycetota bacterium]
MSVVYTARVRVERFKDGTRRLDLPVGESVLVGSHDEIAEHYQREPGSYEPHAATLDYIAAAAGG